MHVEGAGKGEGGVDSEHLPRFSSTDAGDAVAVWAIAGRGGRSNGGSSAGDLRDSPGGEITVSTEASGGQGLSRRRRHGEPGRVRHRQLLST